MIKFDRKKIIVTLNKEDFNTMMTQLYYPCTHIPGFADEIIEDMYKDARELYFKLDKEYCKLKFGIEWWKKVILPVPKSYKLRIK